MNTNMISKFHTSFEIAGGVPVNTKSPVAKRRFMTTHVFLCILDRRVVRHSDEPSVVTYHSDLNWLVCQILMCLISIEVVTKLVTDVFDFWLYAIKDSNLLAPHQMLSLTTKMVNDTCIVCLSGWILRVHASRHERARSDSGMNYHHFWPWWIFAKIHKPHKQGTFFPPINQLTHDRTEKDAAKRVTIYETVIATAQEEFEPGTGRTEKTHHDAGPRPRWNTGNINWISIQWMPQITEQFWKRKT